MIKTIIFLCFTTPMAFSAGSEIPGYPDQAAPRGTVYHIIDGPNGREIVEAHKRYFKDLDKARQVGEYIMGNFDSILKTQGKELCENSELLTMINAAYTEEFSQGFIGYIHLLAEDKIHHAIGLACLKSAQTLPAIFEMTKIGASSERLGFKGQDAWNFLLGFEKQFNPMLMPAGLPTLDEPIVKAAQEGRFGFEGGTDLRYVLALTRSIFLFTQLLPPINPT